MAKRKPKPEEVVEGEIPSHEVVCNDHGPQITELSVCPVCGDEVRAA